MKSVALHNRLTRILLKSFTVFLLLSISFSVNAQDGVDIEKQKAGKKIFKAQCAACHKLDKKLVGPALGKIEERRENDWLKAWIKDNAALRASGDADAVAIFDEYKGMPMTAFPQLSDEDIDNILYYTTVGEVKKATVAPTENQSDAGNSTSSFKKAPPSWLYYILGAAIVIGFLIIVSLLKTVSELKGAPKSQGLVEDIKEFCNAVWQNTFIKVLFTIFALLVSAYFTFGPMFQIGVDEGYQPVQPIAFSHKIHAGDNKVDCQYCHSSARRSKTSGIPSLNVCMNCHKNISEVAEDTKVVLDDKTLVKEDLDKEIGKLYTAVGWDADNLKFTGNPKPVKWIRVHNLADFAYYNHSQHVNVAGLKCQKCHGPVETMEEVYQFAPLTMGWCIDCHKATKVDLKGNNYYKKIHEELSKKYGVDKVTIAQLGGKECGKCHY